ncbi:hypothetical protein B0H16DRAFT_1550589 [Mycena metata]|uniref:Uncharacterized protein n=1 Tax=Mycena metata TaxID=1033252 RepID=A0AAD7N811_9AGAR|nr:hypothetical protein B0H16DRAFT_1550589 [Mycena metata]
MGMGVSGQGAVHMRVFLAWGGLGRILFIIAAIAVGCVCALGSGLHRREGREGKGSVSATGPAGSVRATPSVGGSPRVVLSSVRRHRTSPPARTSPAPTRWQAARSESFFVSADLRTTRFAFRIEGTGA